MKFSFFFTKYSFWILLESTGFHISASTQWKTGSKILSKLSQDVLTGFFCSFQPHPRVSLRVRGSGNEYINI